MDKQTIRMLNKILVIDSRIVFFTLIASMIIVKEYALVILIGLFIAIMNFIVNAIGTYYAFTKTRKQIYSILGAACRVTITMIVAVSLYKNNKYNLFAFLGGYSLHYLAIIIYGLTIKNEEGSD